MGDIPFYTQAAVLDEIIHSPTVEREPELVQVVLDTLRKHVGLRAYFFRSRPDPVWASILWNQGFLSEPPQPVTVDSRMAYPGWDAQEFLITVAGACPEVMLAHAEALHAAPAYFGRAAAGLAAIGPDHLTRTIPTLTRWLGTFPTAEAVAETLVELIHKHLERSAEESLTLFGALIQPHPNPGSYTISGHPYGCEAVSAVPDYLRTNERFSEVRNKLSLRLPEELLDQLERSLLRSECIEAEAGRRRRTHGYWRAAIESHSQNIGRHYRDDLLDWLRDGLVNTMRANPNRVRPRMERYLASEDWIFRRLALFVLGAVSDQCGDLAEAELLVPEHYEESAIHHEFLQLLAARFPLLSTCSQQQVLRILLGGPSQHMLQDLVDQVSARESVDPVEYANAYAKHWRLQRLWMIRDHLTGEAKSVLTALTQSQGAPEHPDFLCWSSGFYCVADTSPIPPAALAQLTPEELAQYVRDWAPDPDQRPGPVEISIQGLANAAAEVVLVAPARHRPFLELLPTLRPEYAHALFFEAAGRERQRHLEDGVWEQLLSAAVQLLEVPDKADPNPRTLYCTWRDVRLRVVSLCNAAVDRLPSMKRAQRVQEHILALLLRLVRDPDPALDEQSTGAVNTERRDPMTEALNRVRPAALEALIGLAVRTRQEPTLAIEPSIWPQIVEVLDEQVADLHPAVRSVFGRHLGDLWRLDGAWVSAQLGTIFPSGVTPRQRWLHSAAWDAYVIFSRALYPDLSELLRPHYLHAIENLAAGYVSTTHLDPVGHLVAHLVFLHYEEAEAEQEQSLLNHLFERVNAAYRGRAAEAIYRHCRTLKEQGRDGAEWWLPARRFWQRRREHAASANFASDFQAEMLGFSALLELVPPSETIDTLLPLLQTLLRYSGSENGQSEVWRQLEEFVARQVLTSPTEAIQFYSQMHQRHSGLAWIYPTAVGRTILERAAAQRPSRRQALALIDTIARRGNTEYRDIYERYSA
jgi:hypothetical protein